MYMEKTLVLYVFHIYDERVQDFFKNSIFEDDRIDFLIICNGRELDFEYPNYKNVSVFKRDNIGFDFGGWSEGLLSESKFVIKECEFESDCDCDCDYNCDCKDNVECEPLYKNYQTFIFANSSIIGPFLPTYFQGKWTDIYLNGLKKNNIHLFGSTINNASVSMEVNPWVHSHIQSYIFSMNKETLEYLMETHIFSTNHYAKDIWDDIFNKEILMSRKIVEKGWNIGSLQTLYKDVDFTFRTKRPEEYPFTFLGDLTFDNNGGKLWEKMELVFIKGNRFKK